MMSFGNLGIMFITAIVSCAQGMTLQQAYEAGHLWVKLQDSTGPQQTSGIIHIVGQQGVQIKVRMWNFDQQNFWTMPRILEPSSTVTITEPTPEQYVAAMFDQMQTELDKEENRKYSRILNFKVSTIVNQVIEGAKTNIKNLQAKKLVILNKQANVLTKQKDAIKKETSAMTGFIVEKEFVAPSQGLADQQNGLTAQISGLNHQIQGQYQFAQDLEKHRDFEFRIWTTTGRFLKLEGHDVGSLVPKHWAKRWLCTRSLTLREILFPKNSSAPHGKLDELKKVMTETVTKTMQVSRLTVTQFHSTVIGGLKSNLEKCALAQNKRNKIFKILGGIGLVMALVVLVVVSVVSAGTLALPVAAGVGLAVGVGIGVETYLTEQPIKTAVHDAGMGATYISTPSPPQIL